MKYSAVGIKQYASVFFFRFHAGTDTSLFAEKEKVKHCFQFRTGAIFV